MSDAQDRPGESQGRAWFRAKPVGAATWTRGGDVRTMVRESGSVTINGFLYDSSWLVELEAEVPVVERF